MRRKPRILDLGCSFDWLRLVRFRRSSGRPFFGSIFCCKHFVWKEAVQLGEFDIVVIQEVIEHVSDQMKYRKIAVNFLGGRGGGALHAA